MHLQDWDPAAQTTVAVGKGIVDWPRTFAAARGGGVKNYFVELDMDATRQSVVFLKALKA
jgi:sugar phosphate isomerase/epimerase